MHSTAQDIGQKLQSFLNARTGGKELQPEEDIFATGYVNSLFVVQLITWMQKNFNFKVEKDDLDVENFRTIAAISQFIKRKQIGETEDATRTEG